MKVTDNFVQYFVGWQLQEVHVVGVNRPEGTPLKVATNINFVRKSAKPDESLLDYLPNGEVEEMSLSIGKLLLRCCRSQAAVHKRTLATSHFKQTLLLFFPYLLV